MAVLYGVHAGTENIGAGDLIAFWRRVEALGFEWISCWDHFVGLMDNARGPFEAVATHAALACSTERVRVGVLVYAMGYRHPAVLASAVATVDHLSGGRAELGLGAGWDAGDYGSYGIEYPGPKERLDKLQEGVRVLSALLRDRGVSFTGEHYTLNDAELPVPPVQARLPIWIGGVGEKRLIPMAARYADGWDAPLTLSPEQFAHKVGVLRDAAEAAGRDPDALRCSAHVAVVADTRQLGEQFGVYDLAVAEATQGGVEGGIIIGSDDYVLDAIKRYEEAGATQILFSGNASWGTENLERAAQLLGLHSETPNLGRSEQTHRP